MKAAALGVAGLLLAAVIALTVAWLALERGLLNGFIEQRIAQATGLALELRQAPSLGWQDGRLVVGTGAFDLRDQDGAIIASVDEASAVIEPLAIMGGTIDIADAAIDGFSVDGDALQERLVTDEPTDEEPSSWAFEMREMQLADGEVRYGAEGLAEPLTVSIDDAAGQWGQTTPLQIDGAGALQTRHFKLEGSGPTLGDWGKASAETGPIEVTAELADSTMSLSIGTAAESITATLDVEAELVRLLNELLPGMPDLPPLQAEARLDRSGELLDVAIELSVEGTDAAFEGEIDGLTADAGIAGRLQLSSPDLTPLLAVFELPAASSPPVEMTVSIVRDGGTVRFDEIDAGIGASDVSGSLSVDLAAEPIVVAGDLQSERLNVDELLAVIGVAPHEAAEAAVEAGDRGVLPSARIDPSAWAGIDIDLHVRVAKLEMEQLPFDRVLLHFVAEDGWLTVDPLNLGLGDGQLLVFGSYDTTQTPPVGRLDARFRGIPIGTVLQRLGQEGEMVGAVDGRVQLEGRGYAVDEWLGSSNGRIVLLMADGRVDAVLLELLGLDLFESLLALVADDAESDAAVPIACLVLNIPVEAGIGRARPILLDSRDSKLTVDGTVGFADETLDLIIRLHPKDASLLSGNQPISVEGSWRSPEIAPAPGVVENPALGWLMAPLAAILPFVDLGLADDAPCGQLIREAEAESAAE